MTVTEAKAKTLSHHNPGDPPEVKLVRHPYSDVIEVDVELITPMLGGGARPREHDPDCWLRPSAVKGHLRFWWRALNAHQFPTIAQMRARERALFGEPARFEKDNPAPQGGPGVVRISTAIREKAQAERFHMKPSETLHYVYFAARGEQGTPAATLVKPGAKATISIGFASSSSSADRAEIHDAFRAWLVLGGAGSRTRRGAGSMKVTTARGLAVLEDRAALDSFLGSLLSLDSSATEASRSCFSLTRLHSIRLGKPAISAEYAHSTLVSSWITARTRRRGKTRVDVGVIEKPDRPRLGSAEPRHASSVILSIICIDKEYFPVVIATRPHIGITSRDDEILNQALSAFRSFSTVKL